MEGRGVLLAVVGVVGIVALTLATALFVAAEFALVAADRSELEMLARDGDRRAERALHAMRALSFQLSAAQLGITLTTLACGFLAEPSITALVEPGLRRTGLPEAVVDTIAVVCALVVATLVQMIVGELVPKNWAIAHPGTVARLVAAPMRVFTLVFGPVISGSDRLANRIVRALGVRPQDELRSARSAEELASMVRSSAEAGTVSPSLATVLTRSLRFGERTAGTIMTPRTRVVGIAATSSVAQLLDLAREAGHDRIPVLADADTVSGVVTTALALGVPPDRRTATPVRSVAEDAVLVPESLRLEPLLAALRPTDGLAVVIDEWGGLAGLVTVADVARELVGTDSAARAASVSGLTHVGELAAHAPGLRVPAGPYDTVGGLILHRLGRLARPGDRVEVDGWTFVVETVDGRRIDRIEIVPPGQDELG